MLFVVGITPVDVRHPLRMHRLVFILKPVWEQQAQIHHFLREIRSKTHFLFTESWLVWEFRVKFFLQLWSVLS